MLPTCLSFNGVELHSTNHPGGIKLNSVEIFEGDCHKILAPSECSLDIQQFLDWTVDGNQVKFLTEE
jgi:hypothetical protein